MISISIVNLVLELFLLIFNISFKIIGQVAFVLLVIIAII